MHRPSFVYRRLGRVLPVFLLCAYATAANSTDTYSGGTLSIPTVTIGAATFTNMVVQVGTIVVPPSGSSGNGTTDTYDPASNRLTVPSVLVGATTYHNVVVTVGSLTSVQTVSGADSYSPPNLTISSVQVGTLTYHDVTIRVGNILGATGGMPNAVEDNFAGGRLQIPAVQVGARVYTNATITVGAILAVGSVEVPDVRGVSQAAAATLLGAAYLATGTVTTAASSSVPVGGVISQSPAPGTRVALGSTVSLVVSTGSGGGGGGGIGTGVGWIPFIATPATGKTPVGQNGLFVLAPDPLAATAANINWILPNTGVIALGASFVLQGTTPGSGFWPYAGIYAALNSQQVVDIYQVNLTNASSGAPAAFPVGNFAARKVPGISLICDSKSSQSNLLDPTSWFVVVHIGASGSCGTSTATGDSWVVVTATATQTVGITTTQIEFLHDPNGLLTALVLNDPATHNFLMYADKNFTNPATLFAGATTDVIVHAQKSATNSGAVGNGGLEFRELGNGTTSALYRLDYTGAGSFKAIPSYNPGTDTLSQDSILTGTKADANNVYFTATNLAGATETLYQEPIGAPGSTPPPPMALYSGGVSPGFSALGSDGSVVVLETITPGAPSTSALGTVPVGVAATATQTPLGPAGGYSGSIAKSQMIVGNGSDYAHSALFINLSCASAKCKPAPTHPASTEIRSVGNTALQALTPTSEFLLDTSILNQGYILEVKGVTDTATATDGGGKLYAVPGADNAADYGGLVFEGCLAFSGGACATTGDFVIPTQSTLSGVIGISSAGNATGLQYDVGNALFSGVVADIAQQKIGVISLTNTNIQFAY